MNFDNFTIKSQEVVQQAVQTAQQNGNQAIEPEHLLKALLDKGESVVKFVFQKLGVNQQLVAMQLDKALSALPKVSSGEPYLSRESNDVLLIRDIGGYSYSAPEGQHQSVDNTERQRRDRTGS